MKKYYCLISILWFCTQVHSQSYIPMLTNTHRWDVLCGGITTNGEDLRQTNILFFEGDTLINDTVYQKLSSIIHYTLSDSVHANLRLLREDTAEKKVYQRYYSAPISTETLLYDFSMIPGDSIITYESPWGVETYDKLDSITLSTFANAQRHIFHFSTYAKFMGNFLHTSSEKWIEGIGIQSFDGKIKGPVSDFETMVDELLCFWENGQYLYQNPLYNSCLVVHVGIPEKTNEDFFTIYPNPAHEKININFYHSHKQLNFSLLTNTGQELIKKRINTEKDQIDISFLPNGIYFIKLLTTESISILKFIKD